MTLFICTCGTSIAGPPAAGQLALLEERIAAKIAAAEAKSGGDVAKLLASASAETNSLARSDCGPQDEVVLLASDTSDGRTTAAAVCRLVEEKLGAKVRARIIEGLQVGSAQEFRQKGIRNLIRIAKQEAQSAKSAGTSVVFNVTGGFKGVVPYLTLLGMIENVDVVYVYDQSDALIRLPALPIRFDQDRIAFALPALQVLNKRGVMAETEFRELLPGQGWNDDPVFSQLVEEVDGMVAPSGAGELALAGLRPTTKTARVFLHRRARQSAIITETHVQRTLPLMNDSTLRSIPHHCAQYDNTDMLVWKEFGGPAPRIFYWLEKNGDVFVADILPHDIHEREFVAGKRPMWRIDYAPDGFAEYRDGGPVDLDSYSEALLAFLDHNDKERVTLSRRVVALQLELDTLREQHVKARAKNGQLQNELDETKARVGDLHDVLQKAERAPRQLLFATAFAAQAHRWQRRKDAGATPYINHVIDVARILAEEGAVADVDVLIAGLLHDTLEDTEVLAGRLQNKFGKRVCRLVEELTDDKALAKDVRKRLQIDNAARSSPEARLIRLADKIANLRDINQFPPADWTPEQRRDYLEWAKAVIDGLRGNGSTQHANLEAYFDREYMAGATASETKLPVGSALDSRGRSLQDDG